MATMVAQVAPVIAPLPDSRDGLYTLPEVQRVAGVGRGALRRAIEDGLVTPTETRKGRGRGAYTLTAEDTLVIVRVAAIAAAFGIAFVTLLRVARAGGIPPM